jgi:hypothetical protein
VNVSTAITRGVRSLLFAPCCSSSSSSPPPTSHRGTLISSTSIHPVTSSCTIPNKATPMQRRPPAYLSHSAIGMPQLPIASVPSFLLPLPNRYPRIPTLSAPQIRKSHTHDILASQPTPAFYLELGQHPPYLPGVKYNSFPPYDTNSRSLTRCWHPLCSRDFLLLLFICLLRSFVFLHLQ